MHSFGAHRPDPSLPDELSDSLCRWEGGVGSVGDAQAQLMPLHPLERGREEGRALAAAPVIRPVARRVIRAVIQSRIRRRITGRITDRITLDNVIKGLPR